MPATRALSLERGWRMRFPRTADDDARFTSEERRYDRTRLARDHRRGREQPDLPILRVRYPAHRRLRSRTAPNGGYARELSLRPGSRAVVVIRRDISADP